MTMSTLITPDKVERLIQEFTDELCHFTEEEQSQILKACRWAQELHSQQKRASGEPYIIHPIHVARILLNLQMDATAVTAGLLHDILEDADVSRQEIKERFGPEVLHLVNGVTKINIVNVKNKSVQERETIRKMILAMDKDIRVILIKLADKRHNMNTLQYMREDKQKRIARECLDIYAPLAGKLGIYSIKTELEDLSLRFLKPEVYKEIKFFLSQKKEERFEFLKQIQDDIISAAAEEEIQIQIKTRAKHFYSIYLKMKNKGKELHEIYDFLGIRILCKTQTQCYTLLGLVHHLYKPLRGRFKDYIAMPKENGYRSLHTTVMTSSGKPLEVQIRTDNMNNTAEYGVAAHWAYKEGKKSSELDSFNSNLLKKLRDINSEGYGSSDFMNSLKEDVLTDTIFVFTPNGDTFELPRGSTAIDFAYHIHTDIGDHCLSAKADDKIIPLNKALRNTQTLTIQTSANAHPHLNWLRFVKTTRAKSKIRNWLNKHDSNIVIDRHIVAKKTHTPTPPPPQPKAGGEERPIQNKMMDSSKVGVSINKERNILIHLAGCCNPTPGDKIIGFISRGRGIIVHREDCGNLKGINDFEERKIDVEWENYSDKATQRFKVNARYVADLFSEIEGAIRKYSGHLISGSINETDRGDLEGFFTVEMNNSDDYKKIAKSIRTIPSVLNIQKVSQF
ncbi:MULTISPECIES: bifunctional (p)ppGpp synthetase/guanosine-3',5'-bis(diphosphate) 3'-pyrophosphohydrolase [unclassified Oceanispirochaeta]|uniref:RelA/SpoT family protein n=1 Tax=unclassified Oceanispirochaeta TaxID=2635722 RepID=UPI001E567560|nr:MULTISPECIES: bifunctional (p)ppGpp synthetase/guanosine-3',5'-bis(diphosphate) 3'-pyrophosphohydrolase [unclassified Oceanispirochaeta]